MLQFPDYIRVIFFDMDHTLIDNDCDLSWKEFLVKKGEAGWFDRWQGRYHYRQYRRGKLDIRKFMSFQLKQFRGRSFAQMEHLLEEHFIRFVRPTLYKGVLELVEQCRSKEILAVLLTATSEPIAEPLARYLQMNDLIGTKPEVRKGVYTGDFHEPYCGGAGKIHYIEAYLQKLGLTKSQCSYWGDSITDEPILEYVGWPVACNPVATLREIATQQKWQIVDLRKD